MVISILRFAAATPGSEIVFDYTEPLENYPPDRRARAAAMAELVAAAGEPWLTHFDPLELAQELRAIGFAAIEDLGLPDMAVRFFGVREKPASNVGPHVIRASR